MGIRLNFLRVFYPNHGKRWDNITVKKVCKAYKQSKDVHQVSNDFGRSPNAICHVLMSRGLISEDNGLDMMMDITCESLAKHLLKKLEAE